MTFELKTTERDTTITPRQLRTAGFMPITLYGRDMEPQCLQVKEYELTRALVKGETKFKLTGSGNDLDVKVQQMQQNPVSGEILHLEFVSLNPAAKKEKVRPPKPTKTIPTKKPAAPKTTKAKASK